MNKKDIVDSIINRILNEVHKRFYDPNQLTIDFDAQPEQEEEKTGIDFLDEPDTFNDYMVEYIIHQPKAKILSILKDERKFNKNKTYARAYDFYRMYNIMINELETKNTREYLVKFCDFYKGKGPVINLYMRLKH